MPVMEISTQCDPEIDRREAFLKSKFNQANFDQKKDGPDKCREVCRDPKTHARGTKRRRASRVDPVTLCTSYRFSAVGKATLSPCN